MLESPNISRNLSVVLKSSGEPTLFFRPATRTKPCLRRVSTTLSQRTDLISSISLGGKINKLNEKISKEWVELLKGIKVTGMDTFVKGIKNEK